MTTQTHLDIFTRLAMMLILVALALYGYSRVDTIAAGIKEKLDGAMKITLPAR